MSDPIQEVIGDGKGQDGFDADHDCRVETHCTHNLYVVLKVTRRHHQTNRRKRSTYAKQTFGGMTIIIMKLLFDQCNIEAGDMGGNV